MTTLDYDRTRDLTVIDTELEDLINDFDGDLSEAAAEGSDDVNTEITELVLSCLNSELEEPHISSDATVVAGVMAGFEVAAAVEVYTESKALLELTFRPDEEPAQLVEPTPPVRPSWTEEDTLQAIDAVGSLFDGLRQAPLLSVGRQQVWIGAHEADRGILACEYIPHGGRLEHHIAIPGVQMPSSNGRLYQDIVRTHSAELGDCLIEGMQRIFDEEMDPSWRDRAPETAKVRIGEVWRARTGEVAERYTAFGASEAIAEAFDTLLREININDLVVEPGLEGLRRSHPGVAMWWLLQQTPWWSAELFPRPMVEHEADVFALMRRQGGLRKSVLKTLKRASAETVRYSILHNKENLLAAVSGIIGAAGLKCPDEPLFLTILETLPADLKWIRFGTPEAEAIMGVARESARIPEYHPAQTLLLEDFPEVFYWLVSSGCDPTRSQLRLWSQAALDARQWVERQATVAGLDPRIARMGTDGRVVEAA